MNGDRGKKSNKNDHSSFESLDSNMAKMHANLNNNDDSVDSSDTPNKGVSNYQSLHDYSSEFLRFC